MYRIGEFSYLCSMSIKTLRYYDKIGVLIPASVDELTGYRYYDIDQLEQAQKIKSLQEASFTLEEIKSILEGKNTEILLSKEKQIRKEELNKIQKINEMKKELNNGKVEVLENPNLYITGDFKKLKSYNNFDEEVEKLNINYHDNNWKKVFVNLEEGYKEENIKCFIGKLISKEDEISYLSSLYNNLKEETLNEKLDINKINKYPLIYDTKEYNKYLYIVTRNRMNGYKKLINYAKENNYQIDEAFIEVENNEIKEIYVGVIDTKEENDDYKRIYEQTLKNLKDIHEDKYVGKWILAGEVKRKYSTIFKDEELLQADEEAIELIINKDGTTNIDNIIWKESYLIKDNTNYIKMIVNNDCLDILVSDNSLYKSIPHEYRYKKYNK